MENSKPTVKKTKSAVDLTIVNIVLTVFCAIADILVVFTLFNTTQFASLSKVTFILVNVLSMILLIGTNVSVLFAIKTKKNSVYIAAIILTLIFTGIGGFGTYALVRVNKSVGKMTGATTTESISTSLVVYSESGIQTITDISQLDGATVGYATGTQAAELGQNHISSEKITVSYDEFQDYSSELLALFNGEIDCAILPTNYKSMFQNESGMSSFIENTSSILDFESKVTIQNSSGSEKDLTKEPFTVLLIGSADGLSDTMILCSVNPISMKITMSSLARDSYVPISCYNGNSSKLNAAHAVSRDCTIDTIENLVGVDIDYYVDTNFQGVVDIVDALGGIVVNSPIEFVGQTSSSTRGSYTVWVPAGDNVLLNGEQALCFARERHLFASGDFARQEHQQEVIEAMLRKIMRTRDVNTFLDVLEAAGNNVQTNMSVTQMANFVSYAIQKTNRYYDSEHVEKVFNLVGSRVTGYSSGLWDDGLQLSLYIYRLYQGSLNDTKNAILRNTDMTTTINQESALQWSVNWDSEAPAISKEYYNETVVPAQGPTTISSYVGRSVSVLQALADSFGFSVNITYVKDASQANGTIVSQDIGAGTPISSISVINVTVVNNEAASTDTSTEAGCIAANGDGSWYNGKCYANKEAAEQAKNSETAVNKFVLTVYYVDENGAAVQASSVAGNYAAGEAYSVTAPSIGGYTIDGQSSAAGTMPAQDASVTFRYKKNASQEHVHSWTGTVTKEATCTEAGEKQLSCSCGASSTEVIGALGHNFVDGYCSRCREADPNYTAPTQPENPQPENPQPETPSDPTPSGDGTE